MTHRRSLLIPLLLAVSTGCYDGPGEGGTSGLETPGATPGGTPDLELSAQALDFGTVQFLQNTSRPLTVRNNGAETLTLIGARFDEATGVFRIDAGLEVIPASLAPGESRQMTVSFAPQGDAAYTGTWVLESDDPIEPEVRVPLSGSGSCPEHDCGALLPDPAAVAPPTDPTVATSFEDAVSFLYAGTAPVQQGVAPGTIDPAHVAVLRGRVLTTGGEPLSGVRITVARHPEYGYTLSRADGWYDMAVNGGSWISLDYRLEGHPPAWRTVETGWQAVSAVDDVRLVAYDPVATLIDFSEDLQVARGSAMTDADGTRKATLLFPQDVQATMTLPDGGVRVLDQLSVRATEYTVGEGGPASMPAPLPPTSGYTYAVELSADEAVEAGATGVTFSEPVIFYLENFLEFPVGGIVPVGYYDAARSAWLASDNGLILEVLDTSSGLADLDVNGLGQAASSAELAALGITETERALLAALYAPGQTLWRVPISHFTPYDCNWPYVPPPGATAPSSVGCEGNQCNVASEDDPCEKPGSILECQGQVLGERVRIAGTPFTLNYRSDRVPGRIADRTLEIPLTEDTVNPDLKRIDLEIDVMDQVTRVSYAPAPGLVHAFVWDGNAYGRPIYGDVTAAVQIGYVYQAAYVEPSQFEQSFARYPASTEVIGDRSTGEVTLRNRWEVVLSHRDQRETSVGGWTLGVHHQYQPEAGTLLLGDGSRRRTGDGGGARPFRGSGGFRREPVYRRTR